MKMADERANRTAGPGALVTVTTDLRVGDHRILKGEHLTVLWFLGMGPHGRATVRRVRDGEVIHDVPVAFLTWA